MFTQLSKKTILLISAVMATAVGLVAILSWSALKSVSGPTGFNRTFITSKLDTLNIMDKPKDLLDFAGATNHHIFFKTKDPAKIYVTDADLRNREDITLNIPNDKNITSRFNCIVDSPNFYILAGNVPAIIKTKRGDNPMIYKFPDALFTRAVLLSDNSFAMRMFENTDQIFSKGNPSTGELKKENNISEKNKDAGIGTDGTLLYDKNSGLLVYVYFYKNQIIYLDTNLNLLRKGKTIDINSDFEIKTDEVSSQNMITSTTPKKILNASAAINNGWLFTYSRVPADNESNDSFRRNSVIDIYDIRTSAFRGSFYIPTYKNQVMNKFYIVNNRILAIYKDHIISYNTPSP